MKVVHFKHGQIVDVFFNVVRAKKMASYIQVHPAVSELWAVFNQPGRQIKIQMLACVFFQILGHELSQGLSSVKSPKIVCGT